MHWLAASGWWKQNTLGHSQFLHPDYAWQTQKKISVTYIYRVALSSDVDENQREQFIPEELEYACRYWVHYLQESKNPLPENGDIHLFLRRHLLGKINEGIIALISLENSAKVSNIPNTERYFNWYLQRSTKFLFYMRLFMMQNDSLSIFNISLKNRLYRYIVRHYCFSQLWV